MGVLKGVRIVEMAGLGPGPFCGMLLADLGADVIVVERPAPDAGRPRPEELCSRGKRSIILDIKKPESIETVLKLLDGADALIEGMRPGVMERLGLGPDICLRRRPNLVYGRMTGWGQYGPLAQAAGHDANYIALSGLLWLATQKDQRPDAPPGLLGDVAGGALYLAIGILAGIINARASGKGQVVDAAMLDGSAHILNFVTTFVSEHYAGSYENARPSALGMHWDRSYICSDGKWIAVQAVEPQFYGELITRLGLDGDEQFVNKQRDPGSWRPLSEKLEALFMSRTRDEWVGLLEGTNTCFAPILDPHEASIHSHNIARNTFSTVEGVLHAAPAPRFSLTPSSEPAAVPVRGAHTEQILQELARVSLDQ